MTEAQPIVLSLAVSGQESREVLLKRFSVLVAGLPGNMATLIAEVLEQNSDFDLIRFGLSSEAHHWEWKQFGGRRIFLATTRSWPNDLPDGTIVVDFTTPNSLNANAEFYIAHNMPFVMGTSGGDRQRLIDAVRNSAISAVIAPNMDPQIVARQMEIDEMARKNPIIFDGALIQITESHQSTKRDVSGTALAFMKQLEAHGGRLVKEIESIRDPQVQLSLGVPEEYLGGHAYHWVRILSPDGEDIMNFETKVHGRQSYVEGTLMAIRFLAKKTQNGARGQVFSMDDVLREGGFC